MIQADRLVPKFLSHSKNGREKGLSLKILTKIVITERNVICRSYLHLIVITAKIIVNFKIVKVTLNSLQVIVLRSSL